MSPARSGAALLAAVVALSLALSAIDAARFVRDPAALFDGLSHDRNHHLRDAQRLAVDLREGDPVGWLRDFERFRMWPPLHGLLASIALSASGLDLRAAAVPSLLGFALTGVLGFLCGWRATGSRTAAVFAFGWIAASPAHHRFAGEAMLESLGAALTLACLAAFLAWQERFDARSARWLALCLSLLFFAKYSYYVVALLGLVAAARVAGRLPGVRVSPAAALRALRHPLVVLGIALWGVALFVAATGGGELEVLGRRVSVTRPFAPLQLGFLAIASRVGWVLARGPWLGRLPPGWRPLVVGHALPIAIWFALPRRLGYFLHHVSPGNAPAVGPDLADRLAGYAQSFAASYHAGAYGGAAGAVRTADASGIFGAALVTALAALAVGRWRALGAAGRSVVVFCGVAALATALHPHHQSRFLHSWIASVWLVAALGFRQLGALAGRPALVLLSAAGLLYAAQAVRAAWHAAPVGGAPSVWSMTDAWVPAFADGRPLAVVADQPAEELIEVRFVGAGGRREDLDVYTPPRRATQSAREAAFRTWLDTIAARRLVAVHVDASSPWAASGFPIYRELEGFLARQDRFARASEPTPAGPGTTWERWTLDR